MANQPSVGVTLRMYYEQWKKCVYCEHDFILGDKYYKPTVEHINPKSKGWKNKDNLCLACWKCNSMRGNIDLDLFMSWYVGTNQHIDGKTQMVPVKVRWPKMWYHGNFIKW